MPNIQVPQPTSSYYIGDSWTPQLTNTVNGDNTDVISLVVRVEQPTSTVAGALPPTWYDLTLSVDPQITRLVRGVYLVVVPMTALGTWKIRAVSVTSTAAGNITRKIDWYAQCVRSKLVTPN